jgi:sec-independent protein translocase protein TatB
MFDVGFSELMVIAVVALVVIGPERLPAVARTLGHLFGRLQRYVNDVKADISREMELDELKKFKNEFEEAAHSVESSVRAEVAGAEAALNSIAAEANPEHAGPPEAVALATPAALENVTATAVGESAAPAEALPPAVPPSSPVQKSAA